MPTLNENIAQVKADFKGIKRELVNKGASIPSAAIVPRAGIARAVVIGIGMRCLLALERMTAIGIKPVGIVVVSVIGLVGVRMGSILPSANIARAVVIAVAMLCHV